MLNQRKLGTAQNWKLTTLILTIGAFRILSPACFLSCKVRSIAEYETVAIENITLLAECKEELKLLIKMKEESEETGLKVNIQKTKIMASGPITSGQIDGETMEIVTDFIFLGSKITVDSDCSHEIERYLVLWRKAMKNLGSTLRIITLPTKVHIVTLWFFQ